MFVPVNVKIDEAFVSLVKFPAPLITPVCKVWFALDEYLNVELDPIEIDPE